MSNERSPWMTGEAAADYVSGETRTKQGRRPVSKRRLAEEVDRGNLRAARVGGRGQLLYRREWLDQWLEDSAKPVVVPARRRA